jgi:hypothetical protein
MFVVLDFEAELVPGLFLSQAMEKIAGVGSWFQRCQVGVKLVRFLLFDREGQDIVHGTEVLHAALLHKVCGISGAAGNWSIAVPVPNNAAEPVPLSDII